MRAKHIPSWIRIFIITTLSGAFWALAADLNPASVLSRTRDATIIGRVTQHLNEAGETVRGTNMFTLMENCVNYFENGVWKPSEDIIEVFPQGAIARKGPNKAILSPSLGNPAVFDIETSNGRRIKGGPRQLQVHDRASGQSVVLAEIDQEVEGELLPPNKVVFQNAFKGAVNADLVYIWKHNYFAQDVILTTRPQLPEGFNPASSRLEVVTEFIEPGKVNTRKRTVAVTEGLAFEEDVFIDFGAMTIIPGKLFLVDGEFSIGGGLADSNSITVKKEWIQPGNGKTYLVESISWREIEPFIENLDIAAVSRDQKLIAGRSWPVESMADQKQKPIALAKVDYNPKGVVIDFITNPSPSTITTFASGETYYIQSSYYTGNAVTFEPGCVIKYKTNAYMLLYGNVTFPSTLQNPVFTSRNDDGFGDKIEGVSGETDSDGDPTKHPAAQALWLYYGPSNMVQCATFRWCKIGVFFDHSSGTNSVKKSLFENITGYGNSAIQVNSTPMLVLENSEKCNVDTPVANQTEETTTVSGSLASAAFCAKTSFYAGGWNDKANTLGIKSRDSVPDTMGAIGPDYFVELVNSRGVVFDRNTGAIVDNNTS